MLRKIKLYGELAKFIGVKTFEADVSSAAEAIRFLIANFPELEKHVSDKYYKVSVGNYDLTVDDLHNPAGQQEIKIIPVISGAGGSTASIIAGVALIAISFLFPGGGAFSYFSYFGKAAVTGSFLTSAGTAISLLGASLILGGIAQALTPVPRVPQGPETASDPRKTYSFSGIQQTSRQGIPVPIVYGKTLCGSVVISAGIDTVQVKS